VTRFGDKKTDNAVQSLSDALEEKYPEVAEVLLALREGQMDPMAAMRKLAVFSQNPEIAKEIEGLAMASFAPLREEAPVAPVGEVENPITPAPDTGLVKVIDGPAAPAVYKKDKVERLNPLVEAAIAERSQFDGDVPELRSGPLPDGSSPAVPVETSARNPVAIGQMLETASAEVQGELTRATQEYEEEARLLGDKLEAEGVNEETALATIKKQLPAPPTGVGGYEAGQLPAKRSVDGPTGSALAKLSPEQRQMAAYKAFSTTQGRRSALPVIEELLLAGLESEGFTMASRPPSRASEVPIYADWTVHLGGQEATQSSFSFIDTAAKVLLRKLVPLLREKDVSSPVLEVQEINTVDVRQVGWAARVVSQEEGA